MVLHVFVVLLWRCVCCYGVECVCSVLHVFVVCCYGVECVIVCCYVVACVCSVLLWC